MPPPTEEVGSSWPPAAIGTFAKAGNLYPYGDQVKDAGFLPALVQAFTYDNKFYCAPKDYSTLALEINTDLWKKAGLTDADIPKDWAGLEAVAKKLTSGKVTGLVIGNDIIRSGAFIKQAGGWIVSPDGKTMTATSAPAKEGLAEVQKLMKEGVLKFSTDTSPSTGWGGEAASVVSALLDLGEAFGYRFPELLADPATIGQWAPYPASCRPQAWAAASAMAMLTVALGVTVDVPCRRMTVRPPSPLPFGALTVSGLRIGDATVSVAVDALGAVTVEGLPADFSLELPEEAAVGALVATV